MDKLDPVAALRQINRIIGNDDTLDRSGLGDVRGIVLDTLQGIATATRELDDAVADDEWDGPNPRSGRPVQGLTDVTTPMLSEPDDEARDRGAVHVTLDGLDHSIDLLVDRSSRLLSLIRPVLRDGPVDGEVYDHDTPAHGVELADVIRARQERVEMIADALLDAIDRCEL